MFSWWQSPEIITKLGTIVAILIIVLSGFGLALKVQSDRLKKQSDQEQVLATGKITGQLQEELKTTKDKLDTSGKAIAKMTIESEQAKSKITNLTIETTKAKETIGELTVKAKQAERGDITRYEFNGMIRKQHGGTVNLIEDTKEAKIFLQINQLERERKYPELLALCKKQISATPDWLTPYLFLGVAQANTGFKTDAISSFEHVIKHAPDDPAYQQAKEFIKKLKQ